MYDRKYQRERLVEAYLSDKNMPSLISIHENLDLLYEFLAQKLNIKIESYTSQMGMPIFFYGKADYDPEIHKPKHLIFDFNEKGELVIRRKRYSESIIVPVKSNPKGPPEISFLLLDTSESMEHSPNCNGYCDGRCKGKTSIIPWGDKSKYHYSVLTVYSFLKYLGVNHLDEHINKIKLGNFSNTTYLSEGLDEIKKSMFSPQFGGTRLNLDKIKKIMSGEGMLIFTISDGEISNLNNWVSPPEYKDRVLVKPGVTLEDEFIRMAKNHYYFHLQIGSKNNFTAKLEKHGLSVSYIKGDEDLAKNVIDLTDGVYRGLLR
jgi:hypothetical protein